jgi:hypothetical protein
MKLQLGMRFGADQLGNHFGSLRIFFMQGFGVGETNKLEFRACVWGQLHLTRHSHNFADMKVKWRYGNPKYVMRHSNFGECLNRNYGKIIEKRKMATNTFDFYRKNTSTPAGSQYGE